MERKKEEKEFEIKERELQGKAMRELDKFFDITEVGDIEPKILKFFSTKARIGIQLFREVNVGKRAKENNIIRIYKEIALDKNEFARFIKKSLPRYYPINGK